MKARSSLEWSEGAAGPLLDAEDDGRLSWQDGALCAQVDPDLFFPEDGGTFKQARRVCQACGVRDECLDFALENHEQWGIWGGLSDRERRQLKGNDGALALCRRRLHEMTDENTTAGGCCRACKRAADSKSARRSRAARSSQRLAA